jgi:predicted phage baseplate assembly protein
VSAPTPTGTVSTLQVRVNDVLWREVRTLYGQGPHDRVNVSRTGDDARTTVEFGDGQTGSRLPTGAANVKAAYRKGIGSGGLVKAGQLSLLLTRPLGVRQVINPADATGAEDPQPRDDARRTAPLTVLTLDRTVSLLDYESFVLPFAGVAKAQATEAWVDGERCVLLTIAGTRGADVPPGSDLYNSLLTAMGSAGDPYVSIRLASYREAPFRLAGRVKVDPAYLPGKVLTAVGDALKAQFSFDARDFGQPVVYSEVVAAIQAVPGVVAVTLDKLYRQDDPAQGRNMILSEAPAALAADGTLAGAEVLTLDETSLADLGLMT